MIFMEFCKVEETFSGPFLINCLFNYVLFYVQLQVLGVWEDPCIMPQWLDLLWDPQALI